MSTSLTGLVPALNRIEQGFDIEVRWLEEGRGGGKGKTREG